MNDVTIEQLRGRPKPPDGKTPNVPLLRKAVEWVEAQDALERLGEDSEWYQGSWITTDWSNGQACGTAYCVAGHVGAFLDERFRDADWAELKGEADGDHVDYVHVSNFAQHALGLNDAQASDLFSATNSAARVRAVAERIAGEAL